MLNKKRKSTEKKRSDSRKAIPVIVRLNKASDRIAPWFPFALAGVYTLFLGWFAFKYHTVGGFGVETDFYAELAPQVKKLLDGEYSPLNYGTKGPVYSFLLAFVYGFVREYLRAGIVLNFISATVFIVTLFHLLRIVFNSLTAIIVTISVVCNFLFQTYTYQAATDMPFMTLCILSMFFLFKSDRRRDLVLSAVFGLLAFLTRYNGAFIIMGSILYLGFRPGNVAERLKNAGLWAGVFIVTGLPWFIPNWMAAGSPIHNDNHINVAYEYYGRLAEGVEYDNWTDALPTQFSGMGDIILYDPAHFIIHTIRNVVNHFFQDMTILVGWHLGIFVVIGYFLFWFAGFDRRKVIFFSFGVFCFFILTIVFYNPRFSLFLLVFYTPLAVWPWTSEVIAGKLKGFSVVPLAVLVLATAVFSATSTASVIYILKNEPDVLEDLRDLGLALGAAEPDKSKVIIGRKPHVAFYSGLRYSMFPPGPQTLEELVEYCRNNDISYIVYSGVEAAYRPGTRSLMDVNGEHTGLEPVVYNDFGAVYRVIDDEKI